MIIRSVSFVAAVLLSGCNPFAVERDEKKDWDQILQLEAEAKAIVRTGNCTSASQCQAAGVGSRACGGPRYYLVYCPLTTDESALIQKLDAVAAAERAYNAKYQIVSTCEFRMPPTVGLTGGMCAAQTSGGNNP